MVRDHRPGSLPAEAEPGDLLGRSPGEWLWDDEYGYARFLAREKATQLPRNWSALYQQQLAPEDGNYFRDDWLRPYVDAPERLTLNIYGGSDYAVTAHGGDYTVHAVVGVDPENQMYLLDLWRGQTSSDQWIEALCDLICKWKPLFWATLLRHPPLRIAAAQNRPLSLFRRSHFPVVMSATARRRWGWSEAFGEDAATRFHCH
jgi:hypothetical protein